MKPKKVIEPTEEKTAPIQNSIPEPSVLKDNPEWFSSPAPKPEVKKQRPATPTYSADDVKKIVEASKEKDRLEELKKQRAKEAEEKIGRKKAVGLYKNITTITHPLTWIIGAFVTVGIFIKAAGHAIQRFLESVGQSFKALWEGFSE